MASRKRPPRRRDKRTRDQKIAAIIKTVFEAGAEGIQSQRALASQVAIPQAEIGELMIDACAASYDQFPGHRLVVGRDSHTYWVEKRTRRDVAKMVAMRLASAATKTQRAAQELDVALVDTDQRELQLETQAAAMVLQRLIERARLFAATREDNDGPETVA